METTFYILKGLADSIVRLVCNEVSLGHISSDKELYFHWEFDNFEYTEQGVKHGVGHGKHTNQKTWHRAHQQLTNLIIESNEFNEADKEIKKQFPHITNAFECLKSFAFHVLEAYFKKEKSPTGNIIESIIATFVRDLNSKPLNYKITVNLEGIVLEQTQIKINKQISIRQTTKADIEKPIKYFDIGPNKNIMSHPAVLEINISCLPNEPQKLQFIVKECVFLMRLFKVGGVCDTYYTMNSDSICPQPFGGSIGNLGQRIPAWQTIYLKGIDLRRFKHFFNNFKIPKDFYATEKKYDFTTVAFERYSDALLDGGSIDKKIMSAVMGLEAIYSNDSKELSFKLAIRVGKVASCFGIDAITIKKLISKAYGVRSKFAHGGHLNNPERKKIATQFGTVESFLCEILNHLRIGIISALLCNLSKNEFLILIDDSLIDEAKAKDLKRHLAAAKKFIK